MQGSTPLTRKTFPLNAARNFDGTVRRFLASSVWSKVPWKAKAHGVGEAAGQSIRGGGVGGAPPPRTGFAIGNLPHILPLCNTYRVDHPTLPRPGARKRFVSSAL